jgi:dienelactone hydrolase
VQRQVQECLGVTGEPGNPPTATVERRWQTDGVAGEEISWSVGYGPPTHGYVLKPAGADRPLPGVLVLHGHDGFKYYGKEKVADGPGGTPPAVLALRRELYGGRALANEMARSGFVVLAHDVFLWGSRRFPLEHMPEQVRRMVERPESQGGPAADPIRVATYNAAARHHEHVIEKYAVVLGTSLAGVVSHEDRRAAAYLQSRSDVIEDRIGCAGLSGGGCRAARRASAAHRALRGRRWCRQLRRAVLPRTPPIRPGHAGSRLRMVAPSPRSVSAPGHSSKRSVIRKAGRAG